MLRPKQQEQILLFWILHLWTCISFLLFITYNLAIVLDIQYTLCDYVTTLFYVPEPNPPILPHIFTHPTPFQIIFGININDSITCLPVANDTSWECDNVLLKLHNLAPPAFHRGWNMLFLVRFRVENVTTIGSVSQNWDLFVFSLYLETNGL